MAAHSGRDQNLSWPCDSTESSRQRLCLIAKVASNRCERCCSRCSLRPAVGSLSAMPGPATDPTHSSSPTWEILLVFSTKQAEHRLHPRFFDHRWPPWRDRRVVEYLHPYRCRADGDVSSRRRNPPQAAAPASLRSPSSVRSHGRNAVWAGRYAVAAESRLSGVFFIYQRYQSLGGECLVSNSVGPLLSGPFTAAVSRLRLSQPAASQRLRLAVHQR